MSNNHFISVIIPCYNDGIYLPETIEKIKTQTFKNFEIIIVNDGSTDKKTISLLEKIKKEGITVLDKENGKMSSARNFGVKHAKGDLIVTVDSDDYFEPIFFQRAIEILDRDENIAVVSSYVKMFGEFSLKSRPRGGGEFNFLFSNECSAGAMIRKSCWNEIGGYDEEMKLGYEDWEFYIRIVQKGWIVKIIPEYLTYYRQTKKSTRINKTEPNRKSIIQYIMNKHKDWYLKCLLELTDKKEIIYTERRTAYSTIFKLLGDRITGKYK